MNVTRLSPVIGAEVFNVDLAGGVDDALFADLHRAFLDHGVLVFRQQERLTPESQIAFARRFGPLHRHPAAPGLATDPHIFVVRTHAESQIANGNEWHTDVSCESEPPLATILQLHDLPRSGGGDTLFASMEAAYRALSLPVRRFLAGLRAVHESDHVYRGRYADRGVADTGKEYPMAVHPVIRTHPETGTQSVYVNRGFTTRIVDVSLLESRAILDWIFSHLERPEFQIRVNWRQNDVVIWDNRCVQHYAIWDYWPEERCGHRVSVKGDTPVYRSGVEPPPSTVRLPACGL
jgi:taurine dioxygenase